MKKYDFDCLEARTWLEINRAILSNNYSQIRRLLKSDCRMMAVVKSNAYGHGLFDYSKALDKLGVDWFGVDSFIEAKKLRKHGIQKPILVLGYTLPEHFDAAAKLNISLTISSFEQLNSLRQYSSSVISTPVTENGVNSVEKSNSKDLSALLRSARDDNMIKVHLKVDTGMHRQGFDPEKIGKVIVNIREFESVEIEGVYSHFAETDNQQKSLEQLAKFKEAIKIVESFGLKPIKHMAATGATIQHPESHFDLVRIGIGLMGIWPGEKIKSKFSDNIELQPIMSWRTIVTEIKSVKAGEGVGYGFSHVLKRDSRLAILPVGYWHGFRWSLSNRGQVLVGGQFCPVVGRVCMDMTIVDVTDLPKVEVGDIVTIIGHDGKNEITAEYLAEMAGSYRYEVITTINPLIQKIYI